MNSYPTIISFYTNTWEYPKHAARLKAECEGLKLEHHIEQLEDTEDWVKNTRLKPTFIYDTIIKLKRPVLWVDVDGSILKVPEFTKNTKCDFIGRHQRTGPNRTWHVGTLYFNYTENSLSFLEKWSELTRNGTGTDETYLEKAWVDYEFNKLLNYSEFPKEYFEILNNNNQNPQSTTVIAHRLSKCERKIDMKKRNKLK